jgi:hypothetical protein
MLYLKGASTMPKLWSALLLVLVAGAVFAAEAPPEAHVSLQAWREQKLTDYPGHTGQILKSRAATLSFGPIEYSLQYNAATDPAKPDVVFPLEGYVGMPGPVSTGWYHGGFLFLAINGQDIGSTPLSSMTVVEQGQRGMLDLVWYGAQAAVRERFVGLGGDDALLVEITLEPKAEVKTLSVRGLCYPSYFTSWNKRKGARRVKTPSALVEEGKPQTLAPAGNWWLCYYDEVFDVARGEGDGPCAMVVLPEETTEIKVDPGDYAVSTNITCRPDVRKIHLAFWKFPNQKNADVLTAFPQKAQKAAAALRTADFTPTAIKKTDFAAVQKEVSEALASPQCRAVLGDRAKEIEAWLKEQAPLLQKAPAQADIATTEKLLQAVDQYNQFYWEVKLARLLEF